MENISLTPDVSQKEIQTNPQEIINPLSQQTPPIKNLKKCLLALVILLFLILLTAIGISAYQKYKSGQNLKTPDLFKLKTNNSLTPTPTSLPATPPPLSEPDRKYINKKLGFEFEYSNVYSVIKEEENSVSLGWKEIDESIFYYLTISNNPKNFVNYQSYKLCSEFKNLKIDEWPPNCISTGKGWGQTEDIKEITIGDGIKAKSFYVNLGMDNDYHIVQTYKPEFELKMFVSGGRLDERFSQILSTLKFTQ